MKRNILFMTVASCIFMVAAATTVLSIERTPTEPIESGGLAPVYDTVFASNDFLVSVDGVATYADVLLPEQDFLVKRDAELKSTLWDTPGNSPVIYTKIVYTLNLKLRDISAFTGGVSGMFVSDLLVGGFGLKVPTLVSASMTINGSAVLLSDGGALDASNYITWVYEEGLLKAQFTLPSLDFTNALAYNDGDLVSMFIMFKVPEIGLAIAGYDEGFPDYQ